MKKNFSLFATGLMVLTGLVGFTACGDDDEFDGKTAQPSIETKDGSHVQLYGFGSLRMNYDDNGMLIGLSGDGTPMEYKNGKYVVNYDEGSTAEVSLSTNSKGLITKFVWIDKDDEETYEVTGSYSYDGSNQMTGLSYTTKAKWQDKYGSGSLSGSGKQTNTWKDGKMTKSVFTYENKESGTEDGEKYSGSWKGKNEYTFEYGTQANPLRQMPDALGSRIVAWDVPHFDAFALLGYCGVGPKVLPTGMSYTEEETEDGDTDKDSGSYSYTYKLNDDGTLASENGTKYYYQPLPAGNNAPAVKSIDRQMRSLKSQLRMRRHSARK